MQHFKIMEPIQAHKIEKWVTVSSESQNSRITSPRVIKTAKPIKQSTVNHPSNEQNKTTRSSITKYYQSNASSQSITPKVIFSPGIIRNTKDWRVDTNRSSKSLNSTIVTARSFISGSGNMEGLNSPRIIFQRELRPNVNIEKLVTVVNESENVSDKKLRLPPTFSDQLEKGENLAKRAMSHTVLQPQSPLSNKVGESRKEIDKLKSELEILINTNLKNKSVSQLQALNKAEENVSVSKNVNNLTCMKGNTVTSTPKVSKSTTPSTFHKNTIASEINLHKDDSKLKIKTYDPSSAREFIRKQKLKRKEKLQQEELRKKEIEELKKQKLEVLRQKTLQIFSGMVKKGSNNKVIGKPSKEKINSKSNTLVTNKISQNLSPTISRARSFDKETINTIKNNIQEPVNKSKPWKSRSKSVGREINVCDKKSSPKIKAPIPEIKPKPSSESTTNFEADLEEVVNKISHYLNNDLENKTDFEDTKIEKKIETNEKTPIKGKVTSPKSNKTKEETKKENNKQEIQDCKVNIPLEIIFEKEIKPRSAISNVSNYEEIKNIPEIKEQKTNDLKSNKNVQKEIEIIDRKLEADISQSNMESKQIETPSWLLPPSSLPYPFNFISAVRKKLEIATKNYTKTKETPLEKQLKDTSIQTTENKDKKQTNVSVQTSVEKVEIKLNSPVILPEKSEELKSFSSHKCKKQLIYSPPKLQSPRSIKYINKEISLHSIKSKVSETSDSDTTKNIPEISEEESLSKHSKKDDHYKNITFDRPEVEMNVIKLHSNFKTESKVSQKSDLDDKFKNINFDRRNKMSLTKPDYKIDISKVSRSNSEQKLKYPSDIESILSQYSKIKSSKSSLQNNSQYSQDFTKTTSKTEQIEERQSLSEKEIADKSSDISKLKSEVLTSLAQKHSNSLSSIPQQILDSFMKNSNENLDSVDSSRKSSDILSNITKSSATISNILSRKLSENKIESSGSLNKSLVNNILKSTEKICEITSKNTSKYSEHIDTTKQNSTCNNVESLEKYSSKIFSEINTGSNDIDTDNEEIKSKQSFMSISSNSSQITTNINKKHSKNAKSGLPISEIPKTDSNSIQEEFNIQSSVPEDSKIGSYCVKSDSTIKSNEKLENVDSKIFILGSENVPNLTKPSVDLKIEKEKFFRETKNNPNQIHLKFQAEVHLLNSFNNSLQQVVAVEKSLLDINDPQPPGQQSTVNFRRGCGTPENMELLNTTESSVCSQDLRISHLTDAVVSIASETALSVAGTTEKSVLSACNSIISNKENTGTKNTYMGVSLGMFDQMIRDEDNRFEHLKAILKLRDKALFDRTKGELAWLEIQKKQLRESGQLNDVIIIKKKQRGLIIKLEQERHEMQRYKTNRGKRLKQAHKQAAKNRKNALREQKNIIKQQLSSTDQIPTKIRRLSHLERRQSGPIKVYRVESRTEQIKETAMPKNNSGTDETINVTTSSVITQISERVSVENFSKLDGSMVLKPFEKNLDVTEKGKNHDKDSEKVKRALLMKEADLEKRRKEAEELLKWHERLKQEEAQVVELERQAKSIQLDDPDKKRVLTGAQLNKIWKGITGSVEKKFEDHKKYQMSKRSLDKFYQNARKIFKEISEERNSSKRCSEDSYTSDFISQSPTKINSSIITQGNDSDISISPNKMLSERLKKISESTRIESGDKKDNSMSSIVSEIISEQEFSDKKSKISNIESEVTELPTEQTISPIESNKKSLESLEEKLQSSDSDLPDLEIISYFKSVTEDEISEKSNQIISEIQHSEPSTDVSKSVLEKTSLNTKSIKTATESQTVSTESLIQENEHQFIKNDEITMKPKEIDFKLSLDNSNIDENIRSDVKINSQVSELFEEAEEFAKTNKSDDNTSKIIDEHILSPDSNISNNETKSEIQTSSEVDKNTSIDFKIKSVFEESKSDNEKLSITQSESLINKNSSDWQDISEHISVSNKIITPKMDSPKDSASREAEIDKESNISEHTEKLNQDDISTLEKTLIDSEIKSSVTDTNFVESKDEVSNITAKISENNLSNAEKVQFTSEIMKSLLEVSTVIKSYEKISETEVLETEKTQNSSEINSNLLEDFKIIKSDEFLKAEHVEIQLSENIDVNIVSELEKTSVTSEIKSSLIEQFTENSKSDKAESNIADIISENPDFNAFTEPDKFDIESNTKDESKIIEKSVSIIKSQEMELKEEFKQLDLGFNLENDSGSIKSAESNYLITESKECDIILNLEQDLANSESKSEEIIKLSTNSQISDQVSVLEKESENWETQSSISEKSDACSAEESEKDEKNMKKQKMLKISEIEKEENNEILDSRNSIEILQEKELEDLDTKLGLPENAESENYIFKSEEVEKNLENIEQDLQKSAAIESGDNIQIDFAPKTEILELNEGEIQLEIKSEISSSHESEFELKSSVDFTSDFEKDSEIEKSKSDEPKTEDKDTDSYETEKESTIIESLKSNQEILSAQSQVPLESKISASFETEKSLAEYLEDSVQNIDENVAGISHIDVRKRVSEILADANGSRGEKSPRVQDLYITAYDVMPQSPEGSPETGSPTNEFNKQGKPSFSIETPYRTEAEELLRKQLEIEQEIIQIERQQQQNIPYLFMREIPNKPPPPYKPPNVPLTPVINSVIPTTENQTKKLVSQAANILYNAYVTGNLKEVTYNPTEDEKITSQKFVFDLCKEIALEVCKPIEKTRKPSWAVQKNKFQTLISKKQVNKEGLYNVLCRKVLQLLNFEPIIRKDNLIIRWSRKKRDHVDEILVLESQTEESEWTNYDSDEQTIKNSLTNDLMDMLIAETAQVMREILQKKKKMSWINYC